MPKNCSANCNKTDESINQSICLQVYGVNGLPISKTKFSVDLKVGLDKSTICLQFPFINFYIPPDGAYVASCKKCPLPDFLTPYYDQTANFACSNASTGNSFTFTDPPVGFTITLDTKGYFKITCINTPDNFIPVGANCMFGGSLYYSTSKNFSPAISPSVQNSIQLTVSDALGFSFDTRQFSVPLTITKNNSVVTISIPEFEFETGGCGTGDPVDPDAPGCSGPVLFWSYVRTISGLIPQQFAPNSIMPVAILAGSNPNFNNLPYMILIANDGTMQVQQSGNFVSNDQFIANSIPPGFNTIGPCSITYVVTPVLTLDNIKLNNGPSNVTDLSYSGVYIRDLHNNDAFDGTVVWAWTDNSNIGQTGGLLNCWVCVGKTDRKGNLSTSPPVQLTAFINAGDIRARAWDTSVAIIRDGPQKGNIVVSYGTLASIGNFPSRAISFDGGKTWPAPYTAPQFFGSITGNVLTIIAIEGSPVSIGDSIYSVVILSGPGIIPGTTILSQISGTPGGVGTYVVSGPLQIIGPTDIIASPPFNGVIPINEPYSGGFGDYPGVQSDKFGNVWVGCTNSFGATGNINDQPFFSVSTNGGITYENIYSVPLDLPGFISGFSQYDFPNYTFGGAGDGTDAYGLWYAVRLFGSDFSPSFVSLITGFIPIYGFNSFGAGSAIYGSVYAFPNAIAASADGKVWYTCAEAFNPLFAAGTLFYKSPGPIDRNYVGEWQVDFSGNGFSNPNTGFALNFYGNPASIPQDLNSIGTGLFSTDRDILYDNKRCALYRISQVQVPYIQANQNMMLWFQISKDNGMTWSDPVNINNSVVGNRSFASMTLDTKKGNLIFGFYDGRNDPVTFQNIDYFAAVLPSDKLDKLVDAISLSNPRFSTPPVLTIDPPLYPKPVFNPKHNRSTNSIVNPDWISPYTE